MINGKIGRDPERKVFDSGTVQAKTSVAVSYKAVSDYQKSIANENGYVTDWYTLKGLNDGAETLMTLKKGDHVTIPDPIVSKDRYTFEKDGKMETRSEDVITTFSAVQVGNVKYGETTGLVKAPPETAGTVKTWGSGR